MEIVYGISTDGDGHRAVAYQGDEVWRAVEMKGILYRPIEDSIEIDERWDVLIEEMEGN